MTTNSPDPDYSDVCKELLHVIADSIMSGKPADLNRIMDLASKLVDQFYHFGAIVLEKLDKTGSKLQDIEEKIDKGLAAEFRAGVESLKKAKKAPNEETYMSHVNDAYDSFRKAIQTVPEQYVPVARFYEGVCLDIRKDQENALASYCSAFDKGWDYEIGESKKMFIPFAQVDPKVVAVLYNNNFLLPLARLIIRRSAGLFLDDVGKQRLRRAYLIDLLQYPWEVRAPIPQSKAQEPWDVTITAPLPKIPDGEAAQI